MPLYGKCVDDGVGRCEIVMMKSCCLFEVMVFSLAGSLTPVTFESSIWSMCVGVLA